MRTLSHYDYLLTAAALALLAGCSGGGGGSVPATTTLGVRGTVGPQSVSRKIPFVDEVGINAPHGNQIAISDASNNTVSIFDGAGKLNAQLTTGLIGPRGLATDSMENLYVANEGNNNILVWAKPYTAITLTLDDAGEYPSGVAIESTTGLVGVANDFATSGNGSVSFYNAGQTTACKTVRNSKFSTIVNDTFDKSGNLFIEGYGRSGYNVLIGEVIGGCSASKITNLTVSNTINALGGIQVVHGNILIADTRRATVYTYAPPTGNSLGPPIASTPLSGGFPFAFAVMQGNQSLWITDGKNHTAEKYMYPAGGSSIQTINPGFSSPEGIAVIPVARP